MKKILLLLFTIIIFTGITFGQTCIVIENDTVALDTKNFTTIFTDDSYEVERYDFGYLNTECSWDTLFTYYYLEQGQDTLQINDSLAYITYTTGNTIYDSVIRETWEKHSDEWYNTFTSINGYNQSLTWGDNDTMSFTPYFDNVDGLFKFWRTIPDKSSYPIIINEYTFNSEGNIIEETIHKGESLEHLYKYEFDGYMTERLDHYPSQDNYRWIVEDLIDAYLIQYQEWDDFFWRWDVINEKEYSTCWFYVGVEEIPIVENVLDVRYYNLLGQNIDKPNKGFYIEQKITNIGSTTKKYYIQ